MQPRRDSTGFYVRNPATAGLPGRVAATTGPDGMFDESNVLELYSVPRCVPAAAEPAGGATGRPSDAEGPTLMDPWPTARAAASLASGVATSLAAASLGFFYVGHSRVCVSSAPRSDLSRLFKHKRKGFLWCFAVLFWGAKGTRSRIGYKCFRKR